MRRRAVILVLALWACSGGDDASDERYALQRDVEWRLQEAVDLLPDDPLASAGHPPMDWYAEYTRRAHSELVVLSGHDAGLAEARAGLEPLGFRFEDVSVAGHGQALLGWAPDDESSPLLVFLPRGSGTLLVLSYDVDRSGLLEFASTVEPVDEEDWVSAGGIIR